MPNERFMRHHYGPSGYVDPAKTVTFPDAVSVKMLQNEVACLERRLADAEQQLEVLRPGGLYAWKSKCDELLAALATYGKHKAGCASGWRAATGSSQIGPCDCGLSAAISKTEGK